MGGCPALTRPGSLFEAFRAESVPLIVEQELHLSALESRPMGVTAFVTQQPRIAMAYQGFSPAEGNPIFVKVSPFFSYRISRTLDPS